MHYFELYERVWSVSSQLDFCWGWVCLDLFFVIMSLPCERFLRKCRHHYHYGPLSERRKNEMRALRVLIKKYRLRDGPFQRLREDYLDFIGGYMEEHPPRNWALMSAFINRCLRLIRMRDRSVSKDLEFLSMCSVWFSTEPREE